MSIEGVFIHSPLDALQRICSLMQKWKVRLKSTDRGRVEERVDQVREWAEEFKRKRMEQPTKYFCSSFSFQ
jgi:hypothetical protein